MDADARDTPSPPAGGACGASVSFAPEDSSRKLLELERTLAAKDAIMEPGVMDSLRTYVASGGKPAAAIELLSENYRGYAQMSSLACRWLELTEPACGDPAPKKAAASASRGAADLGREPGAAGFSAAVSPVAQFNVRGGDASAVATPRDYGDELDTPHGRVHRLARLRRRERRDAAAGGRLRLRRRRRRRRRRRGARGLARPSRKDEAHFLEELIRRTFDPRKVDAVKGRPAWLSRLLDSDRGRGVLFSLAEKHPDCLLITLAIQHAWQHGRADEVRALGPAAASYFSIFHELLADHFRDLIGAGEDDEARKSAVDAISSACCQSLATYLFAQMMLADLARGGDAGTKMLPDEEVTKTRAKRRPRRMRTRERKRKREGGCRPRRWRFGCRKSSRFPRRARGAATVRDGWRRCSPPPTPTPPRFAPRAICSSARRSGARGASAAWGRGPGRAGPGPCSQTPRCVSCATWLWATPPRRAAAARGLRRGAGRGGGAAAAAGAGAPSHVSASPPPSAALTPAPLRSPALLRALFDEAFPVGPDRLRARACLRLRRARVGGGARRAVPACLDLIALAVSADARERSATRGDLDAALATLEAASAARSPRRRPSARCSRGAPPRRPASRRGSGARWGTRSITSASRRRPTPSRTCGR